MCKVSVKNHIVKLMETNIEWKHSIKPGDIITWSSPCEPWLSITDFVQEIHHSYSKNCLSIRWQNRQDVTYTFIICISRQQYFEENSSANYRRYVSRNVKTKEYQAWINIKERCYNPNNTRYSNYGGKGITMCQTWVNSFDTFLEDISFAPTGEHMLGRKDITGNYNKDNCKWMLSKEISNNKSNTILITYNDVTKTVCEWSASTNISEGCLRKRLKEGWSAEEALGYKERTKHKKITYLGRSMSIKEWSDETGLTITCLQSRLRRHWSIAQVLGYEERLSS